MSNLKKGMSIGHINGKKKDEAILSWDSLAGNVLITGDTRVGKTKLMLSMMEQVIKKGDSLVYIMPKPIQDEETAFIFEAASKANRLDDIIFISPEEYKYSRSFNPLNGLDNMEIASLISSFFTSNDDFYQKYFSSYCFSILYALEFIEKYDKLNELPMIKNNIPKRSNITFRDIYDFVSKEKNETLLSLIEELSPDSVSNKEMFLLNKQEAISFISNNIVRHDDDKNIFNELQKTLLNLSTDDLGEIFCSTDNNSVMDDLKNKSPIIIIKPNLLKYKKGANNFIRSIFRMFSSSFSKQAFSGIKFKKDVFFFMDDSFSIFSSEVENLLNRGGGLGLRMIFSNQNIKDDFSHFISANTNIKINMKQMEKKSSYMGSELDMLVRDRNEDYSKLKQKEFYLAYGEESYFVIANEVKNSDYIIDYDDFSNQRINNLFSKFKELVDDEKLRNIVRHGLKDLIKYNFSKIKSLDKNNEKDNIDLNYLFPSQFTLFEEVNLKEHSLDVFEIALNKYKKDTGMEIALVSSLFHDFGRGAKNFSKTYLNHSPNYHANYFERYVKEVLNKSFNDDYSLLFSKILNIVVNHHPSNNKLKKDKEISFVVSANYKARKIELTLLKGDGYKYELFAEMLNDENKDKEKRKKELEEKELEFTFNKNKIIIFNKIEKTKKVILISKIVSLDISSEIFYQGISINRVYLRLDGGHKIELINVNQKDIDLLIEII